jgi:hypothetical protein
LTLGDIHFYGGLSSHRAKKRHLRLEKECKTLQSRRPTLLKINNTFQDCFDDMIFAQVTCNGQWSSILLLLLQNP